MKVKLTRVRGKDGVARDIRSVVADSAEVVLGKPIQPGEEVVHTSEGSTVAHSLLLDYLSGKQPERTSGEELEMGFKSLEEAQVAIDSGQTWVIDPDKPY